MKTVILIALLSISLYFFYSCEKDDAKSNESATRIDTYTDFYDGILSAYYTYRYDEYDRVIERSAIVDYYVGISTEKIIYNDDVIITYQYYAESDTPDVTYDYLNAKGFADSSVSYYNDRIASRVTYSYDNDGYLIKRDYVSDLYKMYFSDSYEIENGNRKKCIYKMALGSPDESTFSHSFLPKQLPISFNKKALLMNRMDQPRNKSLSEQTVYIDTAYYEYNDKINTISNTNKGITWQGLPNKNLEIKGTYKSDGETRIDNFAYEYDEKGRVSKLYYTNDANYWSTYTYVE